LLNAWEKQWTPEQKAYIEKYRSLREHPPGLKEIEDALRNEYYNEKKWGQRKSAKTGKFLLTKARQARRAKEFLVIIDAVRRKNGAAWKKIVAEAVAAEAAAAKAAGTPSPVAPVAPPRVPTPTPVAVPNRGKIEIAPSLREPVAVR